MKKRFAAASLAAMMVLSMTACGGGNTATTAAPAEFKDRGNNYSTVVDKNNFIWVIWSNGGANEVWRGRLNKFGFERQNNN